MHIPVSPNVNLSSLGRPVTVNVSGATIDPELNRDLVRTIKAKLLIAGFDIEGDKSGAIQLNVSVTAFTPGNTALRLLVNFGAGRGSLLYTAEYVDASGAVLAKLDGQERFTGSELQFNNEYGALTSAGGAQTARHVLINEAAKHIVALAENKLKEPTAQSQNGN
jgi:hypothetical protein